MLRTEILFTCHMFEDIMDTSVTKTMWSVVSAWAKVRLLLGTRYSSCSDRRIGDHWVWDKVGRTWSLGKQWDNVTKCTHCLILHTPARAPPPLKHTHTHKQGRERAREQDFLLSQNIISGIKGIWGFRGGGYYCTGTKNHAYGKKQTWKKTKKKR